MWDNPYVPQTPSYLGPGHAYGGLFLFCVAEEGFAPPIHSLDDG